ncbi:unnamed protein product [Adineta steineri]|uniref:Uncharacterized protein n=1 Tax=Adineta steineri TaxID=433720 RepID=A0A814M6R8_9BILA|nr:unnamed protein product [Adineta steineri]
MRRNRLGQITTRLYIVLLIIGHVILILHTIIQPQILTKIFDQPSLTTYDRLMVDHSDTLQCPCSSISSIYNRYITIEPVFHQVCSSPFSSDHWRENVTAELAPNVSVYDARDYRLFLSAHLQCLTGLCNLSMQSVNDSIGQLLSSLYITTQLQSPTAFQTHIDSVVQQNFLTNASLALTEPVTYDNDCSCAFYANCTTQAGFFETNSSEIIAIKGLKIGCTPSESFLSSTLECFYDSSCINLIETKIKNTTIMNTTYVTELLYANSSRFLPNTTIIDLVNELFIETWLTTMNYSAYFDYCSPTYCSYTYIQQLSSLYTVTLLLGLYGGLSVVLKWICPKIVYILFKIYQYRKKQSNRVTFAHTTEAVVIETDITANTSINHQNTTVHSESESTVSTPETISYLVLLRSMFIGFLVLMLVAVALIGPFVYFSRHGKNQATEIMPSCQLTFQFVLSFPTGYIYSPKSFAISIRLNNITNSNDTSMNCICATNPQCLSQVVLSEWQTTVINGQNLSGPYTMPGIITGCFTIDSLLLSTLECFYSNFCLSILYYYMNSTQYDLNTDFGVSLIDVPPLVYEPLMSSFLPNTSLQIIVQQMMVEQWNSSILFDKYYETCSPTYCAYTQTVRTKTFVRVLITFVSTIGGLTVALRLITFQLIKFIFRMLQPKVKRQKQGNYE